jgi:hypothetical protein
MAARFTHAGATPTTLDVILRGMSESESYPGPMHRTAGGARLNYVVGVRIRAASLTLLFITAAEKAAFQSFYRTMKSANTRGTFVADATNYGSDTWSFFFTSEPSYERTQMPGARIYDTVSIDIEDQPVAL